MKVLVLASMETLANYSDSKLRDLPVTHSVRLPHVRYEVGGFFNSNPEVIELGDFSQEDIILYSTSIDMDATLSEIIVKAKKQGALFIELPTDVYTSWGETFVVYGESTKPILLSDYKLSFSDSTVKVYKVKEIPLTFEEYERLTTADFPIQHTHLPLTFTSKELFMREGGEEVSVGSPSIYPLHLNSRSRIIEENTSNNNIRVKFKAYEVIRTYSLTEAMIKLNLWENDMDTRMDDYSGSKPAVGLKAVSNDFRVKD